MIDLIIVEVHAIKMNDSTVRIMYIIDGVVESEILKWKDAANAVAHRKIGLAEIPLSRIYRDSWKDTGLTIKLDLTKARSMHMDVIRKARDKKLQEKDVEYMKALEIGDSLKAAEIATAKQALRDLPSTTDMSDAKNLEELLAIWPESLL